MARGRGLCKAQEAGQREEREGHRDDERDNIDRDHRNIDGARPLADAANDIVVGAWNDGDREAEDDEVDEAIYNPSSRRGKGCDEEIDVDKLTAKDSDAAGKRHEIDEREAGNLFRPRRRWKAGNSPKHLNGHDGNENAEGRD